MGQKIRLILSAVASVALVIISIIYIFLGFNKITDLSHIAAPIFLIIVGFICVGIFGRLAWTDIKRLKNMKNDDK